MSDKILEAVKALGGDLKNTYGPMRGDEEVLVICDDGDYIAEKMKAFKLDGPMVGAKYICTISEFNTYAAEWLKEAYMHNAALDLEWDINNSFHYDGEKYLFRNNDTGVYVDSDDKSDCDGMYTLICKSQEFIDYCAANKPQSQIETPEEKEAFDMIEGKRIASRAIRPKFNGTLSTEEWNGEGLPPVGCKVVVINDRNYISSSFDELFIGNEVTLVSTFTNTKGVKMVAVSLDGGDCCCFMADMVIPIKSPRDKAIDEMFAECYPDKKPSELLSIALGKLYDAGYRKLTTEQMNEFDL